MKTLFALFIFGLIWYIWHKKNPSGTTPENPDDSIVITVTTTITSTADIKVDKDAWEEWDADLYGPGQRLRQLDGLRLNIHFTDKQGQMTKRDITTQRYSYNPDTKAGVIYAYCHLRHGNRPFAITRITDPVDLETGEIIDDLGDFLDRAYQKTPRFQVDQFLGQHEAAALALFSFAKADGAMRAKERAIILNWAQQHGVKDAASLTELENQMRQWIMSKHSFWEAVKSVNKQTRSADYMRSLWDAVVAIVQSDKTPHDQEAEFLRYAAKQWGIAAADIPLSKK